MTQRPDLQPLGRFTILLDHPDAWGVCRLCGCEVCSPVCATLHRCGEPCSSLGCPVQGVR